METGIFIRAEIEGKWESVDIGDERIPDKEILLWLRSRGGVNVWAENVALLLLDREMISKEPYEQERERTDETHHQT